MCVCVAQLFVAVCVCVIAHADGGTRATPGPAHSRPDPRHAQRPTDVCVARGSLGAGRKINHKNNRPALVLSPQRPADRWRICAPTQQGQQRGGARCCSSKWPTRVDRLPPRKTARIAAVAWRASLPVECWHTVFAQCIFPPRIMSHTMPFSVGKPFAKSQRHVRSWPASV